MADTQTLKAVEISQLYKGKADTGPHGPYQIWDFYISHPKWAKIKFRYFQHDGKPKPQAKSIYDIEYAVEKKGEYTNYRVKKLVPDQPEPEPEPEPESEVANKPEPVAHAGNGDDPLRLKSMCYSYGKDLVVAWLEFTPAKDRPKGLTTTEIGNSCCALGEMLYARAIGATQPDTMHETMGIGQTSPGITAIEDPGSEPKQEPDPEDDASHDPGIPDDEVPF